MFIFGNEMLFKVVVCVGQLFCNDRIKNILQFFIQGL